MVDGHYQFALPWKKESCDLEDNRVLAESRLGNLQRRLDKNPELKQTYTTVIEDYVTNGYAEKIETKTKNKNAFISSSSRGFTSSKTR